MRIVCENKDKWLEYRKKRITATKVAGILGKSNYVNSHDIYDLLAGNKEENTIENERMRKGSLAEEHIRNLFLIRHMGEFELTPKKKKNIFSLLMTNMTLLEHLVMVK